MCDKDHPEFRAPAQEAPSFLKEYIMAIYADVKEINQVAKEFRREVRLKSDAQEEKLSTLTQKVGELATRLEDYPEIKKKVEYNSNTLKVITVLATAVGAIIGYVATILGKFKGMG